MKLTLNFSDRPVVTVTECSMLLGISASSIKRKIASGVLKTIARENLKQKILIRTSSLEKFLSEGVE